MQIPPVRTPELDRARFLDECAVALRESALEQDYRRTAMKAIRETTLAFYHQNRHDSLISLAREAEHHAELARRDHTTARRFERQSARRNTSHRSASERLNGT